MRQELSIERISGARALLADFARLTPMASAGWLSAIAGGQVFIKCENLQRTGSFKVRGAYVRMVGLSTAERARGVVAASAGNHAQGVALAAQHLGIRATVFMPEKVSLPKLSATKGYGAEVELVEGPVDESVAAAQAFAERTGAVFIHPFDHPDVVLGQATVGVEILEQCPQVRTILVCTGGGGLLAGVAAAVKQIRPDVKVVGVQAAAAAAYPASLRAGHPVRLQSMASMADGISVGLPGDLPFEIIRDHTDGMLTVSEESLSRALLLCLERSKIVVEPAGAAAMAAVVEHQGLEAPIVVIASGGNIDPLLLMRVVQHGLIAGGRYLSLRLRMPDLPGSLAALLAAVAELRANVVQIQHHRTVAGLALDEVEVLIDVETRGGDHARVVVAGLAGRGYELVDVNG